MPTLDRTRLLLFAAICVLIISAAEVATIVTSVPPSEAHPTQLSILFICAWMICTAILVGPWSGIKKIIWPERQPKIQASLRQVGLFSLLPIGGLFLSSLQLLRAWEALPLAASLFLLELFFEAETHHR